MLKRQTGPKPRIYPLKYHDEPQLSGYVFLHDALNIIGFARMPGHWGKGAGWKFMPHKISIDTVQKYKFDKKRKVITVGKPYAPERLSPYRRAWDTFLIARAVLFDAIHSGKVKAYVGGGPKLVQLPRDTNLWLNNITVAFLGGYIFLTVSHFGIDIGCISFKRSDILRLQKPRSAKLIRTRLTETDLSDLIDVLNVQSEKHDFNYSFSSLWQFLWSPLSPFMGRDLFKDSIFNRLARQGHPRGRSRPLKKDRDAFEAAKPELEQWLLEITEPLMPADRRKSQKRSAT